MGALCACAAVVLCALLVGPAGADASRSGATAAAAVGGRAGAYAPEVASDSAPDRKRGASDASQVGSMAALDFDFDFELEDEARVFHDPWESANRWIFTGNQQVDTWLLEPLTRGYGYVVPDQVRLMIRRALTNLYAPSVLANDLLQREWKDAGTTAGRFAVNSTVGLAGMFDPAERMGLDRHHSDFGQTLALYGLGSGPYLVLPVLGSSTARDTFGDVVDFFFQPTFYLLGPFQLIVYEGSMRTAKGITMRDRHREELKALSDSSVDFYATLHSAYSQSRTGQIWQRREHHRVAESPGGEPALEGSGEKVLGSKPTDIAPPPAPRTSGKVPGHGRRAI